MCIACLFLPKTPANLQRRTDAWFCDLAPKAHGGKGRRRHTNGHGVRLEGKAFSRDEEMALGWGSPPLAETAFQRPGTLPLHPAFLDYGCENHTFHVSVINTIVSPKMFFLTFSFHSVPVDWCNSPLPRHMQLSTEQQGPSRFPCLLCRLTADPNRTWKKFPCLFISIPVDLTSKFILLLCSTSNRGDGNSENSIHRCHICISWVVFRE